MDGTCKFNLPEIIECYDIPNKHDEIPSPDVASKFTYPNDIAQFIHPVQQNIVIELLIGRLLTDARRVLD